MEQKFDFNTPNYRVRLTKYAKPEGPVKVTELFKVVTEGFHVTLAEVKEGDVIVEMVYFSVDPYLLHRFRSQSSLPPPFDPFPLNETPESYDIGHVVFSRDARIPANAYVHGTFPWEQYAHVRGKNLRVVANPEGWPLSWYLGVLGTPGLTAYAGLKKIAQPKEGETVVVSAAAGAVGSTVGQLAKHLYRTRVIGIAGTAYKCLFLKTDLEFDAAINRSHPLRDQLQTLCPNFAVYWDNVGGPTLDLCLEVAGLHARVVECGMISEYEHPGQYEYKNLFHLIAKRIRMEGFIVRDHEEEFWKEFLYIVKGLVQEGKVKAVEQVVKGGIEKVPEAFEDMLRGKNVGKMVVMVGDDPFRREI